MSSTTLNENPVWVPPAEIGTNRFDALYYDPVLSVAEQHLRSNGPLKWKRLRDVYLDLYSFGAYELTNQIRFVDPSAQSYPFINVTEIANPFVEYHKARHIDGPSHALLAKSVCNPGTLLLSMSGSIGRVGVLPASAGQCNSNQHLAKITIDLSKSDPYFLAAYFSSSIGQAACNREAAGAVQKELYLYNIATLPVPDPPESLRFSIGCKVRAAELLQLAALAAAARVNSSFPEFTFEQMQLESHWIDGNGINDERLDSRYYQINFLRLMEELRALPSVVSLRDLVSSSRHGASVTGSSDIQRGVRFIRGNEIIGNRVSSKDCVYLDAITAQQLSEGHYIQSGDLLVTRSGTVGMCAAATEGEIGAAFGSFVIAIQLSTLEHDVTPEYVAAFLNSPLGQAQFRREENGAVQMNINNGELGKIRIPLFTDDLRSQVTINAREYNRCLDRSEQLVASAVKDIDSLIRGELNHAKCVEEGQLLATEFGLEVKK